MTEREKMLAGLPYDPADPDLATGRARAADLLRRFNAAGEAAALAALLGAIGAATEIRPGFACDYGANIRIGARCFVNFNVVMLDCAGITIGDRVQIAPAVQLYTATHPLDAAERAGGLESAGPSASAMMRGSAAAPSSCPVSPSAPAAWSPPAAW